MIVTNEQINAMNCHLFTVDAGVAVEIQEAVANVLKSSDDAFTGSVGTSKGKKEKGNATERKSVFSALSDAREPAPKELFNKQVRRGTLHADKVIGAGEFGEVYLGHQDIVRRSKAGEKKDTRKVAVKLLKAGAGGDAKSDFVRECLMMMKCGDHPNLATMIGAAVQQAPFLCVLEYLDYGDLRQLCKAAASKNIEFTLFEQLRWARQLASGVAHIAAARVIHMDLAARNVLVGANNVVKIADFGMAREMGKKGSFKSDGTLRVAIKWTALEAMMENRFSEASDVWAIGVTIWEILTYDVPVSILNYLCYTFIAAICILLCIVTKKKILLYPASTEAP